MDEVKVKVAQSCLTLLPHGLIHEILQARILEWVAFPFSRGSSQPRYQTRVSCSAGRFFTNGAMREAPIEWIATWHLLLNWERFWWVVERLVHLCHWSKMLQTGWLINNRKLFLIGLQPRNTRSRCQDSSVRALFLVHKGYFLAVSSHDGKD